MKAPLERGVAWSRNWAGTGGTGGASTDNVTVSWEPLLLPKLQLRSSTAAARSLSSCPVLLDPDEDGGRPSCLEEATAVRSESVSEDEFPETSEPSKEADNWPAGGKPLLPPKGTASFPEDGSTMAPSLMGGGVVSTELWRSPDSEYPEAADEVESNSLAESFAESGGVVVSFSFTVMATSTEAASSSWTCWCLEMSNFEV